MLYLINIHDAPTPQDPTLNPQQTKVKVIIETPQQKKIKQITVGIVLALFAPMVMAQVLRIVDLDRAVPFVVWGYWIMVILGLGIWGYIYIYKRWGKNVQQKKGL